MLFDYLVNLKRGAKKFISDEPSSGGHGSKQDRRIDTDRRSCTNPNLTGLSRRIRFIDRRGQT